MNYYDIWCNLKDTRSDIAFARNLSDFLEHLKSKNLLESWTLTRRKLGFGPPELGEFHVRIACRDLAQLDEAFDVAARRSGDVEIMHAKVFAMVTDFRSGLSRDFPDAVRETP
ncbi:MAG: hypothetical protein H6818_09835 [Phycisphaerales bacterium]|nr:hypothetical protein [Phycisphaerales bacterium]